MSEERKSPYYEPGPRVIGWEESLIPVRDISYDLRSAQKLLARWRTKHGGDMSIPEVAMMLTEEVGELAGAIRHGMWSKNIDGERVPYADDGELKDAVGDVILSVVRLCIDLGIDATDCVIETMKGVLPRHYERTNHPSVAGPCSSCLHYLIAEDRCNLGNILCCPSDPCSDYDFDPICAHCKYYDAANHRCTKEWKFKGAVVTGRTRCLGLEKKPVQKMSREPTTKKT